jgi:hypothetical protein
MKQAAFTGQVYYVFGVFSGSVAAGFCRPQVRGRKTGEAFR